ncbi:MAG: flagellar hook-associated protein FlgK [Nitrospirota bacterium]|nr:flagellar hook-associated protein FlgK [Nitrospirota bacterium]
MGLDGLLDIGKSALKVAQNALTVTGHNVANVNTPGYSRQEAVLTERPPINGGPGMVGTGVQVVQIRRIVDSFINRELTNSHEVLGELGITREQLFQIQNIFSDSNNQGIGAQLNEFFSSLQDVAASPSDVTPRSVLLAKSALLTNSINQVAGELAARRTSVNDQVKQTISEINSLTAQIAEMNNKIVSAEVTGQNANDLRDQRDHAVNELAKRIDISVLEGANGALSVYVGRGQVVVENHVSRNLVAVESLDNGGMANVQYDTGSARSSDITSLISGGRIGGLLNIRDTIIPGLQTSFDKLSASLVNEVNQLHRQGYGLDGSTGRDFFSPLTVTTHDQTTNQGSATLASGPITANSLLAFQDYEIRFTSSTAYSIVNTTTGATIKGNYAGIAVTPPTVDVPVNIVTGTNDTLTVVVDGTTSGTITLAGAAAPGQSYPSGASLATELQAKINADTTLQAAGRSVVVTYDTTTSRFTITSNASTAISAVNVAGGTARATLGFLSGTGTAASGTYTGPQAFTVDGIQVTLSGTVVAGDKFSVNSYDDAARLLSTSLTSARGVAASSTRAGVPGNNAIVMALVALQSKSISGIGNTTFGDAYRVAATGVGVAAQSADTRLDAQTILHEQLESFRAQSSGVSIDEELVDMLKYQRLFEAASRLIIITNEMMQTLLDLKR